MYDSIMVATDGSDEAKAALVHAIDLAAAVDATVHVVTVVGVRSNPMEFGVDEVEELHEAAGELVDELRIEHSHPDVEIKVRVLRGKPANTLLDYATEIDTDLIVMGKRGVDSLREQLMGSTTDRLARQTDRPLTIVPAEQAE